MMMTMMMMMMMMNRMYCCDLSLWRQVAPPVAGIVLLSTFGQIMAPFAPSCDRWPATVKMIMLMMIIITLEV